MLIKQREVSTMINQSTTDKLIEMRLTAMADAFRIQMNDSYKGHFFRRPYWYAG